MKNKTLHLARQLAVKTGFKPGKSYSVYDNPAWISRKIGRAKRVTKTEANAKRASELRKAKQK